MNIEQHNILTERSVQSALAVILSDFSDTTQEETPPDLPDSDWFARFDFQINTKANGREHWRVEENSEPTDEGSYYIRLLCENERNRTYTYFRVEDDE